MGTSGQRCAGQRTDGPAVASCRERTGRQRPTAALLEATLAGPEIRIENGAVIAVTGADLGARLDAEDIPLHRPMQMPAGRVLRFGERRSGTRAYIAFSGGITVSPSWAAARHTRYSGLGGLDGRTVAAGDRLPLGERAHSQSLARHQHSSHRSATGGVRGARHAWSTAGLLSARGARGACSARASR